MGCLLFVLSVIAIGLKDSSLPPLIVVLRMNKAVEWGMKIKLQIVIENLLALIENSHSVNCIQLFIIVSLIGIGKMLASVLYLFGIVHRAKKLIFGVNNINS